MPNEPYLPRPGVDERVIVEEMIREQRPEHWEKCDNFVKRSVYAKAKNMPNHLLDDMAQEVMYKIAKYLRYFRFQCTLKTWVNQIIENHIKDEYRKINNAVLHYSLLVNLPIDPGSESQETNASEAVSSEDAFEMREKIRIGIAALLDYANTTSNPIRNRHIIRMVLFAGKTYEEAAIAVDCNPPVVGHVVREAQRHARENMDN